MICFASNSQIPLANCCRGSNSNKYNFCLLLSEFFFIFHGSTFMVRIGFYNRWMKTPLLLCLKGLLGPFCFCSKRYLIPFCRMQKGISYRLQNPKKSAKIKVYCMRCSITLWQFAKRAQITFGAVTKGNLLPFGSLCMRNPRIACNADHVLQYTAQRN